MVVGGEVVRWGIYIFGREIDRTCCWISCGMLQGYAFSLRAKYTNVLTEKDKPRGGVGLGRGERGGIKMSIPRGTLMKEARE